MILGIDEVGRGPWAGPLVVGAVVLGNAQIEGLTDSKKLTKKRRDELDMLIRDQVAGYGLGWVSAEEIDEIGLSAALKLATIRAVEQVKTTYTEIIIDGTINFLAETTKGKYVTTLPKGDLLVPSISAASIIAKVARDTYMEQQDEIYPGYGFKSHVGYGTAKHIAAIDELGVTPLHRLSFGPLKKYKDAKVTTKSIGDTGEQAAVSFLQDAGYTVVARNWKTKFCEIDIIASRHQTIYFIEVKYRKNALHGDGIAAITPKMLRQMKFAAELYIVKNSLYTQAVRLVAVSVSGDPARVDRFLEIE